MADKDLSAKSYLSEDHVFADFVNAVLFDGETRVVSLSSVDTASVVKTTSKNIEPEFRARIRDILKKAIIKTDGENFYLLVGIENQAVEDPKMVARAMLYDALQYEFQLENGAKSLTPVVTIVLYFGTKPWKGAKSLHDLYSETEPRLLPYVPDYRMNLVEVCNLSGEELKRYKTPLGQVFDFIKNQDSPEEIKRMKDDPVFSKMPVAAANMICAYTGVSIDTFKSEGGDVDMCRGMELWGEELHAKGKAEGKAEGELKGFDKGLDALSSAMMDLFTKVCKTVEDLVNKGYDNKTATKAYDLFLKSKSSY